MTPPASDVPLPVSACVLTFNESRNIRRCLDSVRWCEEIVVLDSFSADDTLEIVREFTDAIHQMPWEGYVVQRNRVRKLATRPWILMLDADEEVSDAMVRDIRAFFASDPGHIVGLEFPRKVFYLGKWITHGEWYPDHKLRLFRADKGWSGGQEPHDQVFVNGPARRVRGEILHYTYDDLTDHAERNNRYSTISAEAKLAEGDRFRWRDLLFRPPFRFLKSYLLRRGFLDGAQGFIIACMSSYAAFLKYAKLYVRDRGLRKPPSPPA